MVEFEPPKRKALSDVELHRAVTLLGSSAEGLANSEQLISEQANLREQDSEALSNWIKELQADGSPQALAALRKIALEVFPANLEAVDACEPMAVAKQPEPIFTTEIPIIRRRQRTNRNEIYRSLVPGLASWLVVGLLNLLISTWLELTLLESVIAFGLGSGVAGLVLAVLKSHTLHPLLRSAAVFGGWGVYLGSALALAFTALVVLGGVLHVVPDDLVIGAIPGYRSDVLIAALVALVFSQFTTRSWHWRLLLVVGIAAVTVAFVTGVEVSSQSNWFAYAPLSGDFFDPETALDWQQIGWASFAVALMSVVLVSFALPHRQSKAWSFLLQAPLGFGFSVGLFFLGSSLELSLVTLFAVFLATALSGRDLTDKPIGRWAAASFLLPVIALPVLDFVNGPAVSVLAALIVLLFSDQLVRRTPLHIPSLDTSYGFYGSFQLVTWLGLVTAAPLGVEVVQRLIVPNSDFTPLELALIFGLVVGFIFALLRIFVIRSQDREIRNVEIRNMNLDNLLGL